MSHREHGHDQHQTAGERRAEAREHDAEAKRIHDEEAARLRPGTRAAAAPRDASADQLRLLLLLSTDWLGGDRKHQAEIASLTAGLLAAQGPPVNVDVPHAQLVGNTASCTMGNWTGEPTSYAYAWHSDGVANGATDPTYTVQPADSGHNLACVVTATNALGSTVAPMSNAVAVP
jgi:hypothetical protein